MKVSIPKGTRDFLPIDVIRRNYIFDTIEAVFIKYGYAPIETPTFENLSTLTGKYGEEGDKLLFKVLNNGDFLSKADEEALVNRDSQALAPSIARRGLRYDLTVPFARFVVMHQHAISMPFKRYQIQPVWRADRPQKGRYQEFFQCDVDVVGSSSLTYEAELIQIYDEVFGRLGLPVEIRINHRLILAGIAELAGVPHLLTEMTVAIDKLDKIGIDGVQRELTGRGVNVEGIKIILQILGGPGGQKKADLDAIAALFGQQNESGPGEKGFRDLKEVFELIPQGQTKSGNKVVFDPALARGLSYYTGCIFEVEALNADMGSVGGGGRYDDLTGIFGMKDVPGVGISFGAERIFDVMEEKGLFPEDLTPAPRVLFIAFEGCHQYAFKCLTSVRQAGISADLYPEPVKMQKQMKYANAIGVEYVVIIGEEEKASGKLSLKNMRSGEQQKLDLEAIIESLQK